jgi:hypothetical protein
MGASRWRYWTDYSERPAAAMHALRAQVFATGAYIGPGGRARHEVGPDPLPRPATIEALLESREDDGTHSILDIAHFEGDGPFPMRPGWNPFTGAKEVPVGGSCRLMDARELREAYGDERPTRARVAARRDYLDMDKWEARCVVVYDRERPVALYFEGRSGD